MLVNDILLGHVNTPAAMPAEGANPSISIDGPTGEQNAVRVHKKALHSQSARPGFRVVLSGCPVDCHGTIARLCKIDRLFLSAGKALPIRRKLFGWPDRQSCCLVADNLGVVDGARRRPATGRSVVAKAVTPAAANAFRTNRTPPVSGQSCGAGGAAAPGSPALDHIVVRFFANSGATRNALVLSFR